jgi:sulfatase modifying factor 1
MNPLRRLATAALVAVILTSRAVPNAHAVTIDWVTVGNPGNAADTTGFGRVNYGYQIMKFEFTNAQYAAFLNAIDPEGTNPNLVYNSDMGSNARGGITNTGSTNGSRYAVKSNMGDKPVNYVSWWDAARVSNWLHNGAQTYGSTDSSATAPQNTGAYTVGTATSGGAVAKNTGALYWLPTENEWYKAAYYDPTLSGTGGYHVYGNGFSSQPAAVTSGATGIGTVGGTGNFANYSSQGSWNSQTGNVTTVGTNGGPSYYGAFDMSGNVGELNDLDGLALSGSSRGNRGGNWGTVSPSILSSSTSSTVTPSFAGSSVLGFRLATVPEPATLGMASTGALCACGWWVLKRRRHRRP